MIDEQTIAIVQSTRGALEAHGVEIVQEMYRTMFEAHPEVKAMFNPANQRASKQHGALAGAILAYAGHIHEPEVLGEAIALINHAHVARRVRPEHYAVVGEHLLRAIQTILGDGATPEVMDAWAKAYGFLADVLISGEDRLVALQSAQNGGWMDYRRFEVVARHAESDEIVSFILKPEDGLPLATFKPGQYLPIRVVCPDYPTGTIRTYSLSQRPGLDTYRISVKAEAGGVVSNHLHMHLKVGDHLEASMPCGSFHLKNEVDTPILLLSGGVGQTPMISILDHLSHGQNRSPLAYLHGARHGGVYAFGDEVKALAEAHGNAQVIRFFSEPRPGDALGQAYDRAGFMDRSTVSQTLEALGEADIYLCGPTPFMAAILGHLKALNIPAERIHYEFFGPASALEVA